MMIQNCSKNEAADLVRAGRLQSVNVQPSIGAKKLIEQDEVVIVHLRETSTETVLSLPSFITASDMREVSEATSESALSNSSCIQWQTHTFVSFSEVLFLSVMI